MPRKRKLAKRRKRATHAYRLPPLTVSVAQKLIKLRTLSDSEVARRMQKIGYPISRGTVSKIRRAMGLPAMADRHSGATITRAEQLIRTRKLNDSAIARAMHKEGHELSSLFVRSLRLKMNLPPLGGSSKSAERRRRVEALGKMYRGLSRGELLKAWERFNMRRGLVNERIGRVKGKLARAPLFEQLAEIELHREALFPLLPENIQSRETEIAPGRVVPVALALAQKAVEEAEAEKKRKKKK